MDGNPQSLRLEGKPSDGRASALVATVVLPARFISAGMFRRHTDGRRRKRLDLPSLPGSPSSPRWTPENRPVVDGAKPASERAAPSASLLPRSIVIEQAPCVGVFGAEGRGYRDILSTEIGAFLRQSAMRHPSVARRSEEHTSEL